MDETPADPRASLQAATADRERLKSAEELAVRAFRHSPPPDLRPIYDERGNLVRLLLAGEVVE